jgi:hypothetical protein
MKKIKTLAYLMLVVLFLNSTLLSVKIFSEEEPCTTCSDEKSDKTLEIQGFKLIAITEDDIIGELTVKNLTQKIFDEITIQTNLSIHFQNIYTLLNYTYDFLSLDKLETKKVEIKMPLADPRPELIHLLDFFIFDEEGNDLAYHVEEVEGFERGVKKHVSYYDEYTAFVKRVDNAITLDSQYLLEEKPLLRVMTLPLFFEPFVTKPKITIYEGHPTINPEPLYSKVLDQEISYDELAKIQTLFIEFPKFEKSGIYFLDLVFVDEDGYVVSGILQNTFSIYPYKSMFKDTMGTPYEESVALLKDLDVLSGYPDGTFRPESPINRAEFMAMVYKLVNGEQEVSRSRVRNHFKDVPANHWAAHFINDGVSLDVLRGYPDETFRPDNQITLAEAFTICIRLVKNKAELATLTNYPRDFIEEAILYGFHEGIELDPSGNNFATRGEVANMLGKVYGYRN